MENANVELRKTICRIFNGENWVTHYTCIDNKRKKNYVYKSKYTEGAVLGHAVLGTMKLGEGE